MAFNIARIGVSMVVNAAGFVSGLRSANHAMKHTNKETAKNAKNWSKSIGQSFASTIAKITILTLALRRVMRTVLSEFTNLDEARKFAQSIGQAGENATDKLLAFEFAAKRVGASSAVARQGLRVMSKAIGEAQMGLGEGVQALRILGLDARKLGTMLPTEAFLKVSEAMNKMENSSLKTAAAQKLFGESGVRMLNLARQQGKSIENLIKRHAQLAGVLSEADVAGVEAANDAITDLVTAYKGLQRTFMAAIAPSLAAGITTFANVIADLREKLKPFGDAINKFLIMAFRKAFTLLPGILAFFKGVGVALWNMWKTGFVLWDLFGELFGMLGRWAGLWGDTSIGAMEVAIAFAFVGKALEKLPEIAEASFDYLVDSFKYMSTHIGIGIAEMGKSVMITFWEMGKAFIDGFIAPLAKSGIAKKLLGIELPDPHKMKQDLGDALGDMYIHFDKVAKAGRETLFGLEMSLMFYKDKLSLIFKDVAGDAKKEAKKMIDMFDKALKDVEKLKKNAGKKFKEDPFTPPGEGDQSGKGKRFASFAEVGSAEAAKTLLELSAQKVNPVEEKVLKELEKQTEIMSSRIRIGGGPNPTGVLTGVSIGSFSGALGGM